MKKTIMLLLLASIISCGAVSYAESGYECERPEFNKFSRGIFNILTSFFEIPIAVHEVWVKKNPFMGVIYGIPMGIGRTCFRFAVGVVEAFTFPFEP